MTVLLYITVLNTVVFHSSLLLSSFQVFHCKVYGVVVKMKLNYDELHDTSS